MRHYLRKTKSGEYDFVERHNDLWYINGNEIPLTNDEIKEYSSRLYEVSCVIDKGGNTIDIPSA